MAKVQNAKVDNGTSAVTLADFLNDNSLFDQLSNADQVTAKLVLQSIESAKKSVLTEIAEKEKAEKAAAEKAAAEKAAAEKTRQESMAFFTRHGLLSTSIRSSVQSALNSIIPAMPVMKKVDGRVIPGVQGMCPYTPTDDQYGRRQILAYQLNKDCFIRISMDIESGQISYAKRGRQAKQK